MRPKLSMPNAKEAPGKDHLDSQSIYEYTDIISTQTRRIIQSVMSPLQKLYSVAFEDNKTANFEKTTIVEYK